MLGGVGHVGVSDMKNAQKIKHALRHFGFGFAAGQRVGVQWMGVVGCRDGGLVFGEVGRPELGELEK